MQVASSGFRVQGSNSGVKGVVFSDWGVELRVWILELRV